MGQRCAGREPLRSSRRREDFERISEATLGHVVLVREQSVVGGHLQLGATVHGLRREEAAQLPGGGRGFAPRGPVSPVPDR
jgi:hypothetical protein